MTQTGIYPLAATLIATSFMACGEGPSVSRGALTATWDVLPSGCDVAGVESVEIALSGASERTSIFDCEAGSATIDEIKTGTYDIALTGLDPDGKRTFIGHESDVLVHADINASVRITLVSAPGEVSTTWAFDNGRLCGTNGIETIQIRIFDTYDYLIQESDALCSAGRETLGDLKAGHYLVHAQAVSDSETVFEGSAKVEVTRGETSRVDVILKTDD